MRLSTLTSSLVILFSQTTALPLLSSDNGTLEATDPYENHMTSSYEPFVNNSISIGHSHLTCVGCKAYMKNCAAARFGSLNSKQIIDTVHELLEKRNTENHEFEGGQLPHKRHLWTSKRLWRKPHEGWDHCIKGCLVPAASYGADAAICRLEIHDNSAEMAVGYTQEDAIDWRCGPEWFCDYGGAMLTAWWRRWQSFLLRGRNGVNVRADQHFNLDDAASNAARWNKWFHMNRKTGLAKFNAHLHFDKTQGEIWMQNSLYRMDPKTHNYDGLWGINDGAQQWSYLYPQPKPYPGGPKYPDSELKPIDTLPVTVEGRPKDSYNAPRPGDLYNKPMPKPQPQPEPEPEPEPEPTTKPEPISEPDEPNDNDEEEEKPKECEEEWDPDKCPVVMGPDEHGGDHIKQPPEPKHNPFPPAVHKRSLSMGWSLDYFHEATKKMWSGISKRFKDTCTFICIIDVDKVQNGEGS